MVWVCKVHLCLKPQTVSDIMLQVRASKGNKEDTRAKRLASASTTLEEVHSSTWLV